MGLVYSISFVRKTSINKRDSFFFFRECLSRVLFLAVVVCKAPETLKCCFSLIEVICFGWAREGLIP